MPLKLSTTIRPFLTARHDKGLWGLAVLLETRSVEEWKITGTHQAFDWTRTIVSQSVICRGGKERKRSEVRRFWPTLPDTQGLSKRKNYWCTMQLVIGMPGFIVAWSWTVNVKKKHQCLRKSKTYQIFFLLKFQNPVKLSIGELWGILVLRLAHCANLRSRLRHVSSAPSVAYSTGCSQVVTHQGTSLHNHARWCLTSEVPWEFKSAQILVPHR